MKTWRVCKHPSRELSLLVACREQGQKSEGGDSAPSPTSPGRVNSSTIKQWYYLDIVSLHDD